MHVQSLYTHCSSFSQYLLSVEEETFSVAAGIAESGGVVRLCQQLVICCIDAALHWLHAAPGGNLELAFEQSADMLQLPACIFQALPMQ